jgi:8-oxo-dGTP diphosphatase
MNRTFNDFPISDLPISDAAGNQLVAWRDVTGNVVDGLEPDVPLPLVLIVVQCEGLVLMGMNAWRHQWELPGGIIEVGESPAAAARRELHEETGIHAGRLALRGPAEFVLQPDSRREYALSCAMTLSTLPALTPNEELTAFMWWDPSEPAPDAMSPLDAEIARRTAQ